MSLTAPTIVDRLLERVQRQQRELRGQTNESLLAGLRLALGATFGPDSRFDQIHSASPSLLASIAGGASKAESLAAAFGKRVVWFDGAADLPGGSVVSQLDPRVIFINARRPFEQSEISAHELGHLMRVDAPDLFDSLARAILPRLQNYPEVRDYLNSQQYTPQEYPEEIVARVIESVLTKGDVFRRLTGEQPGLVARILSFVANAYRSIERFVANYAPSLAGVKPRISDVKDIESQIEGAFSEYKRRVDAGGISAEGSDAIKLAIEPFKTKKAVERIADAPGVSPEDKAYIEQLAATQRGVIPERAARYIEHRVSTPPQTMTDAVERKLLNPVAKMIAVSDTPKDVRNIEEPNARAAASYIVVGQHFMFGAQRAKIEEAYSEAEAAVVHDIESMKGMPILEAKTKMLHALSTDLPSAYERYLKNVIATSGPDTTLSAAARELIRRSQLHVGDSVVSPGSIKRAIESLVENPNIVTENTDAKGILAQLWTKGGKTGVGPEESLLLFGNPDGTGANGLIPALARVRNLPGIIDALRGIGADSIAALKEMEAFKSNFSESGRAVSVTAAMKRYAKLVIASKNADTVLATMNKKYASDRAKLLGAEAALRTMDAVLKDSSYKESVANAADALGFTLDGLLNEASGGEWRLKGPISQKDFILSRQPTQEHEMENRRQAEELLSEIGAFVDNPNSDPIKKRTWNAIGERVAAVWLEQVASPMESKIFPVDLKRLMPWLRTSAGVFGQIAGRQVLDARKALMAVDVIGDLMTGVERSENHGIARHSVLVAEAMRSHGLDARDPHEVKRYERGISGPLLESLQHPGQVRLGVGNAIPFTNHIITAEDVALIDSQHAFEQAIRKISEQDIERFGIPSRILDEVGGVTFRRQSVPVGSRTVSRIILDDFRNWLSDNWRTGLEPEARTMQLKNLMARIDQDSDLWRDLVLGFVRETDPTFTRGAEFDKEFRILTAQAKTSPIQIQNFDDLAAAVATVRAEPREVLVKKLRDYVETEIGVYLDRVSKKIDAENQTQDVDSVMRAVFSSLKTEGSFLRPRGKMLAPGSLFQYAKTSSFDYSKVPAIAKSIARARALQSMNQVLQGMERFQGTLETELASMEGSVSSPKTRKEAMNIQENKKRLGEIRFALPELKRKINAVKSEIAKAERTLKSWDEDLSPTVTQTATLLNRGSTLQLLGSVGSVLNNVVGGLHLIDAVTSSYMRSWKHILFSPGVITANAFKASIGEVINTTQRFNPALAEAMKKMLPFTDVLSEYSQHVAETKNLLNRAGILTRFDWKNRREARKAVGYGGDIISEGGELPFHLRAMKWLYGTSPIMWQERVFPRAFDNFINTTNALQLHDFLDTLAAHTVDIGDVRTNNGKELNPNDPSQRISPTELGMSERNLFWLRSTLESGGTNLEKLLFSYYNRLRSTPAQERESVPFIVEEGAAEAIGIPLFEVRRRLVEAYTGRSSSLPSLANVAGDPLSIDSQKYLANALSGELPYLNIITSRIFESGNRSIWDLSQSVPLAGFFKDASDALEKGIKTGDMALALEGFASHRMPLYSSVINRIEPLRGEIAIGAPARALRAATPLSMQKPYDSGYSSNVGTKATRFLRSANVAVLNGDTDTARRLVSQAVQERISERPGITQRQAVSQLRSSIAGRNPETQVLGRKLKGTEMTSILERMTPSQQVDFQRGVAANRRLMALLPHNAPNSRTIFKSRMAPIFKRQRILRSLQAV